MKFYTHLWKWTLEEALLLIRDLQKTVRPLGYHITLGGGVLNNGESDHDLDLYFHPMNDAYGKPADEEKLLAFLDDIWGANAPMSLQASRYPNKYKTYSKQLFYVWSGLRIDVFILKSGERQEGEKEEEQTERPHFNQMPMAAGIGRGFHPAWIVQGQNAQLFNPHLELERQRNLQAQMNVGVGNRLRRAAEELRQNNPIVGPQLVGEAILRPQVVGEWREQDEEDNDIPF